LQLELFPLTFPQVLVVVLLVVLLVVLVVFVTLLSVLLVVLLVTSLSLLVVTSLSLVVLWSMSPQWLLHTRVLSAIATGGAGSVSIMAATLSSMAIFVLQALMRSPPSSRHSSPQPPPNLVMRPGRKRNTPKQAYSAKCLE
jgi:hypothetical protein